jgi:hypothetical protein
MRVVFAWLIVGTVALGVPLVAACGSEDETHFGPPGGLKGSMFPSATATMTTTAPTGSDAAAPAPSDGGVTPPVDGGGPPPVAAKFSTDIFPLMQPNGAWKCSTSGCHQNGQQPNIDPANAANAYTQLAAYSLVANPPGMKYLVPGQNDPTKSAFDCNLKGTCGTGQMPLTPGTPATPADIAKLESWLASGAPNN